MPRGPSNLVTPMSYRSIFISQALMQDPDLVNNLVKTLLRFHEYSVALIADIEAMFYQVRIVGYCGTETT